ncbi:YodC family protein [Planctomicrobium sp. SH527]|uniref:YodC family protein n=1 Tax=Planctomicrobium sp. SH527 TaxID=3448123 RepID=UPI003F5B014C
MMAETNQKKEKGQRMATRRIETGDVVRLKSGGPNMTVGAPYSDNRQAFHCFWFTRDEHGAEIIKHEALLIDVLEAVATDD